MTFPRKHTSRISRLTFLSSFLRSPSQPRSLRHPLSLHSVYSSTPAPPPLKSTRSDQLPAPQNPTPPTVDARAADEFARLEDHPLLLELRRGFVPFLVGDLAVPGTPVVHASADFLHTAFLCERWVEGRPIAEVLVGGSTKEDERKEAAKLLSGEQEFGIVAVVVEGGDGGEEEFSMATFVVLENGRKFVVAGLRKPRRQRSTMAIVDVDF
mmetsp:Transcript_10797/g.27151  ORF Transcript_10797/g.27151 Transcript_10797/m.27151 type:complete len:211 (-) Transcript_10797:249-881(-)